MKRKILIFFMLGLMVLPGIAQAGLVPCGLAEDDPDQEGDQTVPCTFCHFFVMINNIITEIFKWVAPIAALMLVAGGVMLLFAGAKPDMLIKAKGAITATVIGVVIIFGAWIIVNTILTKIGIIDTPSILEWYNIDCQVR
jgi:hypothetical protein